MNNPPNESKCCEKCHGEFTPKYDSYDHEGPGSYRCLDGACSCHKVEAAVKEVGDKFARAIKKLGEEHPINSEWETAMEKLAAVEHERWADWQRYVHGLCVDTTIVAPESASMKYEAKAFPLMLHKRWERQIKTAYANLSEKEKESDREQVRRYWPIVLSLLHSEREEAMKQQLEWDEQGNNNGKLYQKGYDEGHKDCTSHAESIEAIKKEAYEMGRNVEHEKAIAELAAYRTSLCEKIEGMKIRENPDVQIGSKTYKWIAIKCEFNAALDKAVEIIRDNIRQ